MKNATIIVFGMTGDLSRRKIIPALYELVRHGLFDGHIIGTGLEDRFDLLHKSRPFIKNQDPAIDKKIEALFDYQKLNFESRHDFDELAKKINAYESGRPGGRIAYLATASEYFCAVTERLVSSGIIEPRNDRHRIAYEKPFGCDLTSAHAVNTCIHRSLAESQVYRIDHYLAKSFVNNILIMRSTNMLFKSAWNKQAIRAVKILLHEKIGVEGRGVFYDTYGAVKDVLQNHLLQLLALVAMDIPGVPGWQEMRDKKAVLLKAVRVETGVFGQYDGYRQEKNVRPDSTTETYAAVKCFIDLPAWKGVPFYLETGKELTTKTTEIRVIFNSIMPCVWGSNGSQQCEGNVLTIRIDPREGFSLTVNMKKPGTMQDITAVTFDFSDQLTSGPESIEAYERVLREILSGHHSTAVRFDEIEYQWDITEKIYALGLPVLPYAKGSNGPQAGIELMGEV